MSTAMIESVASRTPQGPRQGSAMRRFLRRGNILCGLACALAVTVLCRPAQAQTFADGTFSNWTTTKIIDTTSGATASVVASVDTLGLPGPSRRTKHTYNLGLIRAAHLQSSALYDPSTGAITALTYSYDLNLHASLTGGGCVAYALLLLQNGTYYVGPTDSICINSWTHTTRPALTAASFQARHGTPPPNLGTGPDRPDFSCAGAPIQFGYETSNSNTNPSLQDFTDSGIDNWSVTVQSRPCEQNLGRLKVCKVAGPGVPVGTAFTFTADSAPPFTVVAGPGPGGFCTVGPTFPVGSVVTVTETMSNGNQVTGITVAPSGFIVTSGNTATVQIGHGVTELTFTNKRTGFIEICKRGGVPGASYTFSLNNGSLGPFTVPAGSCSPAIEVPAGTVTVNEVLAQGVHLAGCSTLPAGMQLGCNAAAGISTVNVAPGDVSTQTIAFMTNQSIPPITENPTPADQTP